MKIIRTILEKQLKDTLKNKEVLIQFVMFPLMAIIMTYGVKMEGLPDNFFVNMFSAMFVGMAPLVSMAAIIAEEKEKNTLRVLMLSGVKPWQYLSAVGGYIWLLCMLGAGVLCITGRYSGKEAAFFMGTMAVGILVSAILGAAIGVFSKNQMAATSITVPVMMVFSFLPMLSMFNETIAKVAKFTYTEQINRLIGQIGDQSITKENVLVIAGNALIALLLFVLAYRKRGLK